MTNTAGFLWWTTLIHKTENKNAAIKLPLTEHKKFTKVHIAFHKTFSRSLIIQIKFKCKVHTIFTYNSHKVHIQFTQSSHTIHTKFTCNSPTVYHQFTISSLIVHTKFIYNSQLVHTLFTKELLVSVANSWDQFQFLWNLCKNKLNQLKLSRNLTTNYNVFVTVTKNSRPMCKDKNLLTQFSRAFNSKLQCLSSDRYEKFKIIFFSISLVQQYSELAT